MQCMHAVPSVHVRECSVCIMPQTYMHHAGHRVRAYIEATCHSDARVYARISVATLHQLAGLRSISALGLLAM